MSTKRVGIIGAGQLGRMMALAGTPLDVEFVFFDEASISPSSRLGEVVNPNQQDALETFLAKVDVVTYESENTDTSLVEQICKRVPVYPGANSLRFSQHRLTEKNKFRELGIATADYRKVTSKDELISASNELGLPIVLKTTTMGYDGKGQAVVKTPADIDTAWEALQGNELIAEAFVNFSRELSVIAVRDTQGNTQVYPVAENDHSEGILRVSRVPAIQLSAEKEAQAKQYINLALDSLDHVGVLTLELFDTDNGLVANEMAPRVHNSGHWSMEGAYCSQFENHVRAICGMPLGSTEQRQSHAAMINIIGKHGDRALVLKSRNAFLHTYGKEERTNRKIGHINIVCDSAEQLEDEIQSFKSFEHECG